MRITRKLTAAAAGVGLSLALTGTASAQFFIASGSGTYEITTPGPTSTASADLALSVVAGPFDFASATGTINTDSSVTPALVTGALTLLDLSGDELVITLLGESFGVGQTFESAAGDWTMVSGTGVFAGLVGAGTWSYSIDFSAGFTGPQPMTAEIGGRLIPAPGSIALASMVLGTMAARRRRR